MDYNALNQELKTAATNYTQAAAAGNNFLSTLAKTALVALPAAGVLQQLNRVLGQDSAGFERAMRARATAAALATAKAHDIRDSAEYKAAQAKIEGFQRDIAARSATRQNASAEYRRTVGSLVEDTLDASSVSAFSSAASAQARLRGQAASRPLTPAERAEFRQASREYVRIVRELGQYLTKTDRDALTNLRSEIRESDRYIRGREIAIKRIQEQSGAELAHQLEVAEAMREESHRAALEIANLPKNIAHAAAATFLVGSMVAIIRANAQFNSSLIQTNVHLAKRRELWEGVNQVQGRTGNSLEHLLELTNTLREHGALYRKDWRDILETSSMLEEGLGATAGDVGHLVSASNALRISYQGLGDTVSNVVDKTSISVRGAVELVQELKRVLVGFNVRPGGIGAPLTHLASLEEAMRRGGAAEGSVARIIRPFTSMQDRGGMAMALGGVSGPDFIRDPRQIEMFTRNIATYLEQFRDQRFVFESMAKSFGMAADEAQIFIDAVRNRAAVEKEMSTDQLSLQKRFEQQSAASGRAWSQLIHAFKALMLDVMSPMIPVVRTLAEWMQGMHRALVTVKESTPNAVKALIGLGIAVATLVGTLMFLSAKLVAFTAMFRAAQTALVGTQMVLPLAGVGGGMLASAGGFLTRLVPLLIGIAPVLMAAFVPLAIAALVAGTGVYFLNKWAKEKDAERNKLNDAIREMLEKGYQGAGNNLRGALRNQSGLTAASEFERLLNDQRGTMLKHAREGNLQGVQMLEAMRETLLARVGAERATYSREKGYADVTRKQELQAGEVALLAALDDIKKTMIDLKKAADSTATARARQKASEDARERDIQQVQQALGRAVLEGV